MKKIVSVIMAGMLVLSSVGCGRNETESRVTAGNETESSVIAGNETESSVTAGNETESSAAAGAIVLFAGAAVLYVLGIMVFERKDLHI